MDVSLILEAYKTMLSLGDNLGVPKATDAEKAERGYEYLHNEISEMYAQKVASLVHFDGVRSAFNKVHSYKYLDDPTFAGALRAEFKSQGIPADEQHTAIESVNKMLTELREEAKAWAEKDSGFHPDLDEVMGQE